MIYPFACYECKLDVVVNCRPLHPPEAPACTGCGEPMSRVYGCLIDTSGCRDADEIPVGSRVTENTALGDTKAQGVRKEARYQRAAQQRRRQLVESGNRKSTFRHTHSVPVELYHGKIKQTGDKNYWNDPKNLNRHKSSEVSP